MQLAVNMLAHVFWAQKDPAVGLVIEGMGDV